MSCCGCVRIYVEGRLNVDATNIAAADKYVAAHCADRQLRSPAMSVLPDHKPVRQPCVGTMLSEVANAMVRLYREQFGRGPTQACAYWCSSDVLVVKLEGVLTPEERRLVEIDQSERVGEI